MNIMEKYLPFLLLAFCSSSLVSVLLAQQASGLYYENFSGIHGVVRNPASGQHGLLQWDVNIASINAYAQNNYAYVNRSNLFHFFKNMDSLRILGTDEQVTDPDAFGLAFYNTNKSKRAILNTDIMGPSLWINLKPIGLGLFSRLRSEGSIPLIPAQLGYYQYRDIDLNQTQNLREIKGAGAVWSEIGINISSNSLWYDESLSIGMNIKYIRAHEGIYGATTGDAIYTKATENIFQINQGVMDLAYTGGVGDTRDFSLSQKGSGLALDIGLSKDFDNWRLGVSLRDIGNISFKSSAQHHRLVVNELVNIDVDRLSNQTSLSEIISDINTQLQDDNQTDSTLINDRFTLISPTRLNVTMDHHLSSRWFVHTSLVQNLAHGPRAIHAENNLAITPRYESRWLTVSAPLILSNYETIRIGLAGRLGILTIGSDDLFSLFGKRDFNGSSIYAAIKINPFGNGNKKGKKVHCPKIKRSPWDSSEPIKGARRMRSPGP